MQESKFNQFDEILGEIKKTTKNDFLTVDLRNIVVDENDNVRQLYEGIESLAESIKEFGLKDPLKVSKIRGTEQFLLVDGFRRMRAIHLLLERGEIITTVKAFITNGTPEQRLTEMILTGVQKKTLHPIEQAEAFLRLKNYGWDVAKIAAMLVTSDSNEDAETKANGRKNLVYRYLKLAEFAPTQVKKACLEGKISHDTVIKMIEISLKETATDSDLAEKVSKEVFEAIERNTVVSEDGVVKTKKVKTGDVMKKVAAPKEKTFVEKLRVVSDELFSNDTNTDLLDAIIKLENATVEELTAFFKKVAQNGKFEGIA